MHILVEYLDFTCWKLP